MKTALVFGSTGLVGSELVEQLIDSSEYSKVILVNRRSAGMTSAKVTEIITDYDRIADRPEELLKIIDQPIHVVFCSLGTTIKKAKSQESFYRVDHDYVVMTGKVADALSVPVYVAVSAIATDLNSSIYYSRVKAEAERDVSNLGFAGRSAIHFLRPSLLLGNRKEFRFGERFSIILSPLFNWMMMGPLKRYKAVQASEVAASMIRFSKDHQSGIHIHENEELFG